MNPNPYRKAREDAGIGLREAARLLGTYPAAVHEWETTERKPSEKYLVKMADLYKTTVDRLIGRTSKAV